VIPLKK
jgi:hypothetical protein